MSSGSRGTCVGRSPASACRSGSTPSCILRRCANRPDDAGPEELFTVNAGATAALVDYAVQAGARRFVYGSTGGVYGYRVGRIRESTEPAPFDLYTVSKWHGETVVVRERRLSTAVIRYFFPYGPGQRTGIVPRLADSLNEGRPITVYRQRSCAAYQSRVCRMMRRT